MLPLVRASPELVSVKPSPFSPALSSTTLFPMLTEPLVSASPSLLSLNPFPVMLPVPAPLMVITFPPVPTVIDVLALRVPDVILSADSESICAFSTYMLPFSTVFSFLSS